MIYVTGDTHAKQNNWKTEIHPVLSENDIIIVAGDFGLGFWGNRYISEEFFFDWLENQSYTVLFVDGNHENFDKLNSYSVEEWMGGKVHRIRKNIIHLMRGEIYSIEDITLFTFGGGFSLDSYRRAPGIDWWPDDEMPTGEEYKNAENNLSKAESCVDFIITHTAPYESIYYLSTNGNLGIKKLVPEELPLTSFFDILQKNVSYTHWYFGHMHVNEEIWRKQTAIASAIRELKSGNLIKQWQQKED